MPSIEQKLAREKESLHNKTVLLVNEFKNEVPPDFIYRFENIIFDFITDLNLQIYQVEKTKVDRSEVKELIIAMNKGFEQVDKRFEQVDKRFEQVDKRFEDMLHYMEKRFEQVDKRFEQVDKRFEDMLHYMEKRFEQVDKRFNFIQWLISLGFVVLTVLITIFQFLSK